MYGGKRKHFAVLNKNYTAIDFYEFISGVIVCN
jgi:hypothetical protein